MCVSSGFFFFKQKTAYEMRISDWSSDVCSSDLAERDLDLPDVARKINAANGWGKVARRRRALTGEALPEFVAAVRGLGDDLPPDLTGTQRDLTLLLLCTGLRWTSAAGLRWPEVDFRAKTITVPADRMKGKVEHTLPLGPEMLAMLRSEEHTSELQSLMRNSYAVFCLKKKK